MATLWTYSALSGLDKSFIAFENAGWMGPIPFVVCTMCRLIGAEE